MVEAYGKDVQPRELEATLRIEYRSKLLNPKWAEAMANQARAKHGVHSRYIECQKSFALVSWLLGRRVLLVLLP